MSSLAQRLRPAVASLTPGSCVLGFLIVALYALYGWHPFIITTAANVDDGLYVQHATGFLKWLSGGTESWLGGFDCFLLSKVPLYGLWLACLHLLGLPLRVGDFLLLVAGAFLFRRALRPVRELRTWEFAVVLVLLLANPYIQQDFFLRRLTFNIALTNLCLVAAVGLALRAHAGAQSRMRWAMLAGFFFSLCYLNREEASWLTVAVVAAFIVLWTAALLAWRRGELAWRAALRGHAFAALAFFAGALPLIVTVCSLNRSHYGVFMTTFRRSSAVTDLTQRLTSLEPAGHQPYVPIARPTRLRAYELSPSFARLKPSLEAKTGYWRAGNPDHAALNGRKAEDQELFVSYFEFCLLWAAKQAGAKRAHQMEALFRAAERELTQAVRDGRIVAGASGPAILAAPVPGDFWRLVSAFWRALTPLLFVAPRGYVWPNPDAPRPTRAQAEEAGLLTQSWVGNEPLPNLKYSLRAPIVRKIILVQTAIFPLLFLAMPAMVIWRRREAFTRTPSPRGILLWSFAVPYAALGGFCMSMAVVDVLGFRFLHFNGYVVLGFSPLTVLCALAFVGLLVLGRRSPEPESPPAPAVAATEPAA
jgi:hypothetical protein